MLTLLNKISRLYSLKLLTRAIGLEKVQKYADIICESPFVENILINCVKSIESFFIKY